MRRAPRRVAGTFAAALYAGLLYGFILLPVAVLVLFSFQDGRLPVPPFRGFTTRWHADILADRDLLAALGNSLLVAVLSSALAVVLGFLAAHGLARHAARWSGAARALLLAPLAVSTLVIGMGLLVVSNALGLPRSLLAAGVGHVVINLPLAFAILFSQMGAHQVGAERAARDLGAREWQVLLLVSVPMLWPALFAAFALSMTFSLDEFIVSFLLTRFDVTLPVEIWTLLRSGLNPRTNAAGSLVFALSVLLVVLLEIVAFRRRSAR